MDKLVILSILGMGGLALLFAAVLAAADKKFRVQENPKVEEVRNALPGINCGACGFLSCHDYAVQVAGNKAAVNLCKPGGENTQKHLSEIMGVKNTAAIKKIAVVHCAADNTTRKKKAEYSGIKTCRAANIIKGGEIVCSYGCLGCGDCVASCPFDAIKMVRDLPVVDTDKCVACGKCVQACPRNIISLEEYGGKDKLIFVACSSHDKGPDTRKACSVGCIACGICVRFSNSAFEIKEFLSFPVQAKLKTTENTDAIISKCPTKVIKKT